MNSFYEVSVLRTVNTLYRVKVESGSLAEARDEAVDICRNPLEKVENVEAMTFGVDYQVVEAHGVKRKEV